MADQNQGLPQVPAPVGQAPDVGAEVDLTSGASPGTSPLAQPGYDPSQALSDELSSLRSDLPGYTPPDTSAQDTQIAKYQHTAEESNALAEKLAGTRSAAEEKMAQEVHEQDAQFTQLFAQFPSRQVFYSAGLQSAPLMSILGVLGGKAAGLSGRAMLGAMNGMMEGINSGSEENYQHHMDAWKQQIAAYKERHEQQLEIYNMMLDAYKGRVDAALKARDFALDMTKDTMDERDKVIKNSIDIFKARTEALTNIDKLAMLFGEKRKQDAVSQMGGLAHDYYMQDVTTHTVPPGLKPQALSAYYNDLARKHPDPAKFDPSQFHKDAVLSPRAREIGTYLAGAGISLPGLYSMNSRGPVLETLAKQYPTGDESEVLAHVRGGRAQTTIATRAATQIGTQEAKLVPAAADIFSGPNSLANRVEAAAKKVNFGDLKTASRIRMWMQGNHWSGDDLALYLSTVEEARSKLVTLLQNGGMSTEGAQHRAQEVLPTPTSFSSMRKILDNSRAVVQQVEAKNSEIIQGLSSGVPIDKIINMAKVPMNRPGQAGSQAPAGGQAPAGTPQQPGAAPPRPQAGPPATPPGGAPAAPPQAAQPGAQAPRGPRTIQVGAQKVLRGVTYEKGADGHWYAVQQ